MNTNPVCDFCHYESPVSTEELPTSQIVLSENQAPVVLQLDMSVQPGVVFGDYQIDRVRYRVCTNCILRFIMTQQKGG